MSILWPRITKIKINLVYLMAGKYIENFSGIPQLERHLQYIGESKVDNEIVNNLITRCDGYFSAISNSLLITRLLELSEEDRAALEKLDELMRKFTRRPSR